MYCKHCGNQMDPVAVVCVRCGAAKGVGTNYCANCGANTTSGAAVCTQCGAPTNYFAPVTGSMQKSKITAGLLGIFLGGFGVHNFYLGFIGKAVGQIVLTVFSCGLGGLWGFIEGILILAGTINKDADGLPLGE